MKKSTHSHATEQGNIQVFLTENNNNSIAVVVHPQIKHRLVIEAVNLAKQADIPNVSIVLENNISYNAQLLDMSGVLTTTKY